MNLTGKQRGMLGWTLVVLAIVAAAWLGFTHPLPPPPADGAILPDVGSRSAQYNVPCYFGGAGLQCDGAGKVTFGGATEDAYATTLGAVEPTGNRTINLPNVSGTVMLTNTPGAVVLGTNTITGTLQISHGLTTPQTVFCTLLQDSEANAASCSATISGSTVTVKTWKADGATAGSVGKIVSWMVGGQP